jgi:orotidine-5'-phosphate decarboxylase
MGDGLCGQDGALAKISLSDISLSDISLSDVSLSDRLIVALDVPTVDAARGLVGRLGAGVTFYKIGLELVMAGGLALVRELTDTGKRVFLDMKLLDIETTVERATRNAAAAGATFLTVHAQDAKTLRAALAGRAGTDLKVLGVTVLTNLQAADLNQQGIAAEPADLVARRAELACDVGCDGVVVSGLEAARVRAIIGAKSTIVTPGIRLPGANAGDQARVSSPRQAIAAGADHLVVGRPITCADDPAAAVCLFHREIEHGLRLRALGPQG